MKIGVVGLGKMGANIALNLMDHGHEVVGFDASDVAREKAGQEGITAVASMAELVGSLSAVGHGPQRCCD